MVQASEKPGNFILVRFIACREDKATGYHRTTGPIRDRVIRLLLWLGWAEEYYDRAYGGHHDHDWNNDHAHRDGNHHDKNHPDGDHRDWKK